jgi:phytoene synthase
MREATRDAPCRRHPRGSGDGDVAACRALLRHGSRTFYAASYLLPRSVRDPATALYAFCRLADDAVDETGAGPEALADLTHRLQRAYAGQPMPDAADRAFARVVRDHAIPVLLPGALLEGFRWDAEGRRYETLEDLQDYAARVAGTVGTMMAMLMGVRCRSQLARAADLGVAMQLSNIARDVGEDARAGRLYLPLSWLREAGIRPDEWLAAPVHTPALGSVVARLLREADLLYGRAEAGISRLPRACRPGIHTARLLYAAIGDQVRRRRLDSVSGRAVVPAARKAALLARGMASAVMPPIENTAPPLAATAFLVEAAAAAPRPVSSPAGLSGWAHWLLDLFEQLERRERSAAPAATLALPED